MRISDWSSDVFSSDLLDFSISLTDMPDLACIATSMSPQPPNPPHAAASRRAARLVGPWFASPNSGSRPSQEQAQSVALRSDERRVGTEGVSTSRYRCSPFL